MRVTKSDGVVLDDLIKEPQDHDVHFAGNLVDQVNHPATHCSCLAVSYVDGKILLTLVSTAFALMCREH